MKKQPFLLALLLTLCISGCAAQNSTTPSSAPTSGNDSTVLPASSQAEASFGDKLVSRAQDTAPSAPENSITFEEACRLFDSCSMATFYLTEPVSNYEKYYFGTVDYQGEKYYSIYPYLTVSGKKLYVGTNCLVACDGSRILAENWMGGYELAEPNTNTLDRDYHEFYPDAKISPNQALSVLVKKEDVLGLEKPLSDYLFEIDESPVEVAGVPCYCIVPKLEYTDHTDMLKNIYVTSDGKNVLFSGVKGSPGEYEELK